MFDEKELMFQVKAGQLDKLATLFENNKVQLFNYFVRSGNNRALSEDLVQETFMKVLAYRTSFTGSSTFKSWMYGIARNTIAEHYRKNKNQALNCDMDDEELINEQTLSEEFDTKQQNAIFNQSLASISREDREIIMLSRFQQLNYQEISTLLDCNLNTLKSRMRNALSKLQMSYQKLVGEIN
ncbi:MAG: RNA polymerase sigma factor [Colwellia sp.]|nr:RNA polymerase sigma factor [Colwellia sp.]